jgi:hypothetical protein
MQPHDSDDIERILAQELGRLAVGGGIAAPRIPTIRFEIIVEVGADPQVAATKFTEAITRCGRLVRGALSESGPIVGVVGGGFLNKNPAVVEIRVAPIDDGRCRATLGGTAKEGRIKQRTAEKAVRRVLGASELAGIVRPPAST